MSMQGIFMTGTMQGVEERIAVSDSELPVQVSVSFNEMRELFSLDKLVSPRQVLAVYYQHYNLLKNNYWNSLSWEIQELSDSMKLDLERRVRAIEAGDGDPGPSEQIEDMLKVYDRNGTIFSVTSAPVIYVPGEETSYVSQVPAENNSGISFTVSDPSTVSAGDSSSWYEEDAPGIGSSFDIAGTKIPRWLLAIIAIAGGMYAADKIS